MFSVLVPAFCAEPWLEQCVMSAMDQATGNIEIVICDDCSTDDTLITARVLMERYPLVIRVLENPVNRGLSFTRNRMIDAARGEYLWFLDADDFLLPGALGAVEAAILRHSPDIVSGDYRKDRVHKRAFNGPRNVLLLDPGAIFAGVCGSRKMYAWLRITRRTMWQNGLRFPEGKLFEDAAVTPFLLLQGASFIHLSRALVQYRITALSIMGRINADTKSFRYQANLDLAHALDGIGDALTAAGVAPGGKSHFAISHFIAMEFRKIVRRIKRAGPAGTGRTDIADLVQEFRQVMEHAAPVGFADLSRVYLRKGRFVAWSQLRRAMAAGTPAKP